MSNFADDENEKLPFFLQNNTNNKSSLFFQLKIKLNSLIANLRSSSSSLNVSPAKFHKLIVGQSCSLHILLRIFKYLIVVFLSLIAILTVYMALFRDSEYHAIKHSTLSSSSQTPSQQPHNYIIPRGPFSSISCYADQMKFLLGLSLYNDRITPRRLWSSKCSQNIIDHAQWHPHYRSPPPSPSYIQEGIHWFLYATSCSRGLERLVGQLVKANIPFTVLGLGRGYI
jgi:hypothetical protein